MRSLRTLTILLLALATSALAILSPASSAFAQPSGPSDLATSPDPRHHPVSPSFLGVWRDSAPASDVTITLDPAELKHSSAGFHLVDVEVNAHDGARLYNGLFHSDGGGESVLETGLDADAFQSRHQQHLGQGRCLAGFEAWRENGATLYAGVWRDGCGKKAASVELELDVDAKEFPERVVHRSQSHHLVDLETVVVDGRLRVAGLWHPGADPKPVWVLLGVSWHTFHEQAHDMKSQGYQLMDVEAQLKPMVNACNNPDPVPEDPDEGYALSGFWRAGDGVGKDWLGADYLWSQLDCATSLLGQGYDNSGVLGQGESACDQGDIKTLKAPPPNGKALRLTSLELYLGDLLTPCYEMTVIHDGFLHDSGTTGEP